ncbi:MAG: hypothetical protein ACKOF7_01985, partial [Phycisphaerales bacterium]
MTRWEALVLVLVVAIAPFARASAPPALAWPQRIEGAGRTWTVFAPCFTAFEGSEVEFEQSIVRGDAPAAVPAPTSIGRVTVVASGQAGALAGEVERTGVGVRTLACADGGAGDAERGG